MKNFSLKFGTIFKKMRVGYREEDREDSQTTVAIVGVEFVDGDWFCDCGQEGDKIAEQKARLIVKWSQGKLGKA